MGGMLHARGARGRDAWPREHLEAIARDGLRISGLLGEHLARGFDLASDPARLPGRFDLILLTVKAYDTAAIADAHQASARTRRHGGLDAKRRRQPRCAGRAIFGLARVIGGRVMLRRRDSCARHRACDSVRRADCDRTLRGWRIASIAAGCSNARANGRRDDRPRRASRRGRSRTSRRCCGPSSSTMRR